MHRYFANVKHFSSNFFAFFPRTASVFLQSLLSLLRKWVICSVLIKTNISIPFDLFSQRNSLLRELSSVGVAFFGRARRVGTAFLSHIYLRRHHRCAGPPPHHHPNRLTPMGWPPPELTPPPHPDPLFWLTPLAWHYIVTWRCHLMTWWMVGVLGFYADETYILVLFASADKELLLDLFVFCESPWTESSCLCCQ